MKKEITLDYWEQELPKTLYNRLLDEEAKKLDGLATTYPHSYKYIIQELKDKKSIMDCDFHVFESCKTMLGWDLNNVYQYFESAGL